MKAKTNIKEKEPIAKKSNRGARGKWERVQKYMNDILSMARSGNTNKDICAMLDISEDTFYEYCKKYPDFSESIKNAKVIADTSIENALFKRAQGYEIVEEQIEYTPDELSRKEKSTKVKMVKRIKKHIPGDVAAQFIWLKNRQPNKWRDKQERQVTFINRDEARKAIEELFE